MIYKVSYVVADGKLPGAIKNENKAPEIGSRVRLGLHTFEIIDVYEVMPPRGNFAYMHAIVEPVQTAPQLE
jgi:hypothetical protein